MKVLLIKREAHGTMDVQVQLCRKSNAPYRKKGSKQNDFSSGNAALPDCIACRRCKETGRCVYHDIVNEFVEKAEKADGFVFGSPVYFAHPSGRLMTFYGQSLFIPAEQLFSIQAGGGCSLGKTSGHDSLI